MAYAEIFKHALKVFKTADDERQVVLYLMRDGETIGERLIDKPGVYGYTAESISDSVILLLRLDALREIIHQNLSFCQAFNGLIFTRLQKAENRMLNYRFNRTEKRVCFFLKEMAEHDSRKLVTGDREIKFLMTQAFIGDMVSVSRQHVMLVLRDLAKRRILKYNRRRLVIFRPDLL
ncbi:MAG: Crp/Fnr family transcriptional regulator [Thermoanaerobaculia bacterium]|nr:Crp/Fnr family transcriptional regulator [Thermoanaerobaculia bacterium]